MAELVEGFNGPMTLTIKASAGKGTNGGGPQWVAKFPPGKGLPEWDVRTDEFPTTMKMVSQIQPAAGEILQEAWVEQKTAKGKTYLTIWTKEQKAEKKAGGFGGGKGPNYSLEQEAYKDGLLCAIQAIRGGIVGRDGSLMPMEYANIKKLAAAFSKDILEAGK